MLQSWIFAQQARNVTEAPRSLRAVDLFKQHKDSTLKLHQVIPSWRTSSRARVRFEEIIGKKTTAKKSVLQSVTMMWKNAQTDYDERLIFAISEWLARWLVETHRSRVRESERWDETWNCWRVASDYPHLEWRRERFHHNNEHLTHFTSSKLIDRSQFNSWRRS